MRNTPRHAAGMALAAALALVASTGGTAAAASAGQAAARAPHQPSPQARSAGITRTGDAFMGWAQDAGRAPRPTVTSPASIKHARDSARVASARTPGIDVSKWQGNVDWAGQWAAGKRFAFVKATEGTTYTSPSFGQQYTGSYAVGMVRGAYHFALPDNSSGTAQADWFVSHGGGWSADGKTLPGVLDIEYNPYGATCYGLSQSAMRSWIAAFTARYRARTGREAVIYSTTSWWTTCTGNTSAFAASNPLWIARYNSTPGTLPAGWAYYTFWQYSDTPIDQDYFNGDTTRLRALALG